MRALRRILLIALLASGCARERSAGRAGTRPDAPAGSPLDDRPREAGLPPARADSFPAPPLMALRIAAPGSAAAVPPPEAPPAEPPPPGGAIDRLPVDDALRPPVLRAEARLAWPESARGWVEVDVLVDAGGEVADVRAVAGTADSATVRVALAAARSLRYFPARLSGRAVPVWCRQRFERNR